VQSASALTTRPAARPRPSLAQLAPAPARFVAPRATPFPAHHARRPPKLLAPLAPSRVAVPCLSSSAQHSAPAWAQLRPKPLRQHQPQLHLARPATTCSACAPTTHGRSHQAPAQLAPLWP
jgi:hypothetical protein